MNQEGNSSFNFEEYSGKVGEEKLANNQLKRKTSSIKTHMAAIITSSILALTACAQEEDENHLDQEVTVEGVTETGGIPFSEERINEFEGNVVITNPEALENVYKNDNNNRKDKDVELNSDNSTQNGEDAKNELNSDSMSPEEGHLVKDVIQREAEDTKKDLAFIFKGNKEAKETKDLTQTQVIVKQAIDNALRINGLIGKNGLSANELEQVIKNSEAERAKLKEKKEGTIEVPLDEVDPEYWKLEDNTYVGINPPEDTATSVWFPTGEQTPYQKLGDDIWKSDPTWRQVSLEFDKIVHQMSYEKVCPTNMESGSLQFIPVYTTIDSAIQKKNPWQDKAQYQKILNAKIGKANALIAGIYVPIEKVDGVSSFDSIGFPLEEPNANGKMETVGYINGNDLLEGLSRNMVDTIQNEESDSQEFVTKPALQP